jgi:ABC-2 type transport system permease protein
MEIEWLAVEKIVAGMVQALVAGFIVIPLASLIMGASWQSLLAHPLLLIALALLVSFLAAAMGLTIGCSVGQTQVGLMFSLVVTPMIMFGCAYYPWSALSKFPVLQKAVLVNPLVYASEGFRSALAPGFPHLRVGACLAALAIFDLALLTAGLRQFRKKAVT